jgi:Holliday junction resolvase
MTSLESLRRVSEKVLQQHVEQMLLSYGWSSFHDLSGATSGSAAKGFPDLVCIRGTEQLILELKTEIGRVSFEQKQWLKRFELVKTSEARIIRPSDLDGLEQRLRPTAVQLSLGSM